jgi:hypothetical protein
MTVYNCWRFYHAAAGSHEARAAASSNRWWRMIGGVSAASVLGLLAPLSQGELHRVGLVAATRGRSTPASGSGLREALRFR